MLGLYAGGNDCINLFIAWPNVFERDRFATGVNTERVLFNVKTNRARNRVRDHQRRRCKKSLLRVRVNAAVEIAIAREHGGGVEIAINHFFLNDRIKRAGHAVARRAGEGHDTESKRFKLAQKPRFFEVQLNGFRARRE